MAILIDIDNIIEEMAAAAVPIVSNYPILTDGHSKTYYNKKNKLNSNVITAKDFRKQRKLSRIQLGLNAT
jgi:hypothetical protein